MPVVETKSAAITARDANLLADAIKIGAILKQAAGVVEVGTGDSVGSIYRFCQVPSNVRISQVLVSADDLGTTGTMDIGLYQTTKAGGAVVDADFFSAAVDMKAAAINNSDVTHGNAFNRDETDKFLWEALGLSADPGIMYDVCGTLTEVSSAGGTVAVKVEFAQ